MTTFPLTDCCELLAVDPKTLRQWLKHANMPLHAHPTDRRRKCLTLSQVQHLAGVHGRILQLPETLGASEPPTPPDMDSAIAIVPTASTLPMPLPEEAHLSTRLSHLERQVALLHEQLTRLTSALLVLPQPGPDHPLVALSTAGGAASLLTRTSQDAAGFRTMSSPGREPTATFASLDRIWSKRHLCGGLPAGRRTPPHTRFSRVV